MRRLFFAALTALMLATAVPAAAITYGEPDNGRHPQVGLVAFFNASGQFIWRCSGTLLDPTTLLTAGHCTAAEGDVVPVSARVWFDDSLTVSPRGYPYHGGTTGTPHPHPSFAFTLPNTHDVGIVKLDRKVTSTTAFGVLPPVGFLDDLATQRGLQNLSTIPVGYGLNEVKPQSLSYRTRYMASQTINDLQSSLTDGYNVRMTNAPGNGTGDGYVAPGGTCNGDSGGPVFYDDGGLTIVGITSFGLNTNCKGGDYAFRTDLQDTQNFITYWLSHR